MKELYDSRSHHTQAMKLGGTGASDRKHFH